jgi:hypothetical protein
MGTAYFEEDCVLIWYILHVMFLSKVDVDGWKRLGRRIVACCTDSPCLHRFQKELHHKMDNQLEKRGEA